jgi:hypothetical protein
MYAKAQNNANNRTNELSVNADIVSPIYGFEIIIIQYGFKV